MAVFWDISTATASRNLSPGVELRMFSKEGEKSKTRYIIGK
jgi:Fic family protein